MKPWSKLLFEFYKNADIITPNLNELQKATKIKIKDDKAYIFFKPLESGLVLKNVKKTQFEIAGNDKKYYSARASVIKDYIQVSSSQVKKPQFVRYAWSDTASATLFNEEGFPASSFSSE